MVKISIVIPVYKKEKWLDMNFWRLANVCKYPKDQFEVIICDGTPPLNFASLDVCKKYKDQLNVVYIQTGNGKWQNPGRPRNIGFRQAVGEVVAMEDGDYLDSGNSLEVIHDWFFNPNKIAPKGSRQTVIEGGRRATYVGDDESFEGKIDVNNTVLRGHVLIQSVPLQNIMDAKEPDWYKKSWDYIKNICSDRSERGGNIYLWACKKSTIERVKGYNETMTGYSTEDDFVAYNLHWHGVQSFRDINFATLAFAHPTAGPNGDRNGTYNQRMFRDIIQNNKLPWTNDDNWGKIDKINILLDWKNV